MRRILSSCTFLVLTLVPCLQALGQDDVQMTCAQRLRLARATYEAGRLHELVGQILDFNDAKAKQCFDAGFTLQEKVDALKLLVLAHIYLENPTEADNAMLLLLRTDHFYKPDKNSDPQEYIALYNTFRTDPIITFYGRFGGNLTLPTITKVYPVSEAVNGSFKPSFSIQAGFGAEKGFFPKAKSKFFQNTEFMAEGLYVSRNHLQVDEKLFTNLPADRSGNLQSARNEYKSLTSWIDLSFFIKYRLNREAKWDPYIGIGGCASLLLKADIDLIQTQQFKDDGTTLSATVTGPAIDVKNAFFPVTYSATALGGVKTKLGDIFLVFEGRVQFGLVNLVNGAKRYIPELTADYVKSLNNYRQSNFSLNIGVTYPYYKPKKLSRKK